MIIYKATNTVNNKCYIGQTRGTLDGRIKSHLKTSRNTYKKSKTVFSKAILKYGIDIFNWEVICEVETLEELNEKEIYYISFYNTVSPYGYNLTLGGSSFLASEELKKKISDKTKEAMCDPCIRNRFLLANSNKVNPSPRKDRTFDEEYGKERASKIKKKISESLNNYFKEPENRKKISNKVTEYFTNPENRKNTSIKTKEAMQRLDVKINLSLRDPGSASRGKKMMNNGNINKYVIAEETPSHLEKGWTLGRIKRKEVPINA